MHRISVAVQPPRRGTAATCSTPAPRSIIEFVLRQPRLRDTTIHILTLAPERHASGRGRRRISFRTFARCGYARVKLRRHCLHLDARARRLRQLLLRPGPSARGRAPVRFQARHARVRRVLAPGGNLFFTFRSANIATADGISSSTVTCCRTRSTLRPVPRLMKRFYRYQRSGWQIAEEGAVRDSQFVAWDRSPAGVAKPPRDDSPTSDLAAAARAVACVRLVKRSRSAFITSRPQRLADLSAAPAL